MEIADAYRKKELPLEKALSDKVLKAILHYGNIELGRPNDGPRFHASCLPSQQRLLISTMLISHRWKERRLGREGHC